MYGAGARRLQDHFDTRRLADALTRHTVHDELTPDDLDLIGRQTTVWISTVDADGWPDVSYKGGDTGFVRAVSPTELRIPMYDGNGMMRTLGNVADTGRVALLFVDPSVPRRLRLHGTARVSTDAGQVAEHAGADAVLIVTPLRIFPNCGRYIHGDGVLSEHVPRPGTEQPVPSWKLYDWVRDALPERDRDRVARARSEP